MTRRLHDVELPLGETLELLRALWAVDHALLRASRRMEATLGITGPQRMVLRIVGRFPGISAGDLARVLHVHPSTLTGVLARLQRDGHVRRWPDPRDERRSLVGLTAKGRERDVATAGTVEEAVTRLCHETAPRARAQVLALLRRVAALLEPPGDGAADELEVTSAGRRAGRALSAGGPGRSSRRRGSPRARGARCGGSTSRS